MNEGECFFLDEEIYFWYLCYFQAVFIYADFNVYVNKYGIEF